MQAPPVTEGLPSQCLPQERGWKDGDTTTVVDHHTGERPKDRSQLLKYTVEHTSIQKAYQFFGFR
jgi:hypothetical protein